MRRLRKPLAAAPLVLACAALAGCGSSVGLSIPGDGAAMSSGTAGYGSSSGGSDASMSSGATASSGMSDMDMGTGVSTKVPEVNGVKPVATQVLATSYWQGMKIQAQSMTPTPILEDDGSSPDGTLHLKLVEPPKHSSFHLMVMLSDQHTGEPIAYSAVWATILNSAGKAVVDDASQIPMNSAYMGPHYGSNVPHLAPGRYTLKLVISPPAQARHVEYEHVWLHQFSVTEHFTWKPGGQHA